jgi:hypothetical protein
MVLEENVLEGSRNIQKFMWLQVHVVIVAVLCFVV